jgi:nucleotide-binding universal stress UspA family protein
MISPIKKILYATDLSKNSAYAFQYAVDMAERSGAAIVLLHVIEPIPPGVKHYIKLYVDEAKWDEKLRYEQAATVARIRNRLQEFCNRVDADVTHCVHLVSEIMVVSGHPVEEILRVAEEKQADAIVLGTHGKGFLMQTFLGSVARSVLDRTRKPVFIVPLPQGKIDLSFEDGI